MGKLWSIVIAVLIVLSCYAIITSENVKASSEGDFTYEIQNDAVIITRYKGSASVVTIPSSIAGLPVRVIGDLAFSSCMLMTSIVIPDGVTFIGDSAFDGCQSLTNITIPSSVVTIGNWTFCGCQSLTSITIPSGVTIIGNSVFDYCPLLSTIVVVPNNGKFASVEGVLYDKNVTTLVRCPMGKGGNFSVPDGVTTILDRSIKDCDSLTNISLPNSVTSIGNRTFETCTSLVSIKVDPSNAFYSSVDSMLFDKAMTALIRCPQGKSGSVVLPSSVTTIGDYAFQECGSITNVTLPTGIVEIGIGSFCWCSALASIDMPDGTTTIGNHAFHGCTSFKNVSIPDSVKFIGDYAFTCCPLLSNITIPDTVEYIGIQVFTLCSALTSIDVGIGNVNYCSIDGILYDKMAQTLIKCPEAKTGTLSIPQSVRTIDDGAFYESNLAGIIVPDGVTTIGEGAFTYCISLTTIQILCDLTTIENRTFMGCESLTVLNLPMDVTTIGVCAFSGCQSLTNITIPANVTEIGDYAFEGCHGLTNITIPAKVSFIGNGSFSYCSSLTSIYFEGVTAPTVVGSDWIDGTNGAIMGYASSDSDFPHPGEIWNGLTMGGTLPEKGQDTSIVLIGLVSVGLILLITVGVIIIRKRRT